MLKRLLGKKSPIDVWVIKQIDKDLLHLCGQGQLSPEPSREKVLADLGQGRYEGPVHMASGGLVLNAKLFAALAPLDTLALDSGGKAHWQGRVWITSQVPQRCWTYEGDLVAQPNPLGGGLVSAEDVTGIRQRVEQDPRHTPIEMPFASKHEHKEPELAPKDEPQEGQDSKRARRQEWRGSEH